jgi:DNA gyrase subunit B
MADRRSRCEEKQAYDASSIKVLEGTAPVRLRPGMYVGNLHDGMGQHHMIWEAVANAIDEHLSGHARRLSLRFDDTTVTVDDDGRGIPPAALEATLTQLHGSGSRDGHSPHVHVSSSGLHGVGLAVVAAVSRSFVAESHHRGEHHRVRLHEGRLVEPLTHVGGTRRRGTRLSFEPDPSIFTIVPWDRAMLERRMWELACLNPGLHMTLDDALLDGRSGADDVRRRGAEPLVVASGASGDVSVDCVLGWRDGGAPDLCGFVSQYRADEGSHVEGLWDAFTDAHPGVDRRVVPELYEPGLVGWLHVGLYHPSFGDPARSRLSSPEARHAVRTVVGPALRKLTRMLGT